MKRMVILIFLLCSISSFANNNENNKKKRKEIASFSVVIVNYSDNEPLTGVKISIKELGKTIYTGIDGDFSLTNIPAGEYSLIIQHPSYTEKLVKSIVIRKEETVTIKLFPN